MLDPIWYFQNQNTVLGKLTSYTPHLKKIPGLGYSSVIEHLSNTKEAWVHPKHQKRKDQKEKKKVDSLFGLSNQLARFKAVLWILLING
jgi:hypothetical protein